MPKVVDHDERRRVIAEAVYVVIEQRGMEQVSLRDVAKEASVSMGAVQHYFRTKDEMLLFALSHMRERVLTRLTTHLSRLKNPTRRQYIREVARVMLPTDAQARQEAIVNIAFVSRSLAEDPLQVLLREGYQRLIDSSDTVLREARDAGEISRELDVKKEGDALFFLVQGLIGPTLIGALSIRRAMAIIDHQLDRLFATS